MASQYTTKWELDGTNKRVKIRVYKSTVEQDPVDYPTTGSLDETSINAYCTELVRTFEKEAAQALIDAAAYDAESSTLDPLQPIADTGISDEEVTAALLVKAKADIEAEAVARGYIDPYSLVSGFQDKYDAASITIDLSTIVFDRQALTVQAAIIAYFFNDLNGDGIINNGDELVALPVDTKLRVKLHDAANYTEYSPNDEGYVRISLPDGYYDIDVVPPAGYEISTGNSFPITAAKVNSEEAYDVGTIGLYETP